MDFTSPLNHVVKDVTVIRHKKNISQRAAKVLDVNCDAELSDILRTNLVQANFEVVSVKNGSEALHHVRAEKPDVILFDSSLPDINCREFSRQLKELRPASYIPIILIGADISGKSRDDKSGDGIDSYISKPFDPGEVVALIQSYLKNRERAVNVDPLTGLPNLLQVTNEVNNLIRQKKAFAAIFLDIVHLNVFTKLYDVTRGDMAIQLLAEITCEIMQRFGIHEDLVGHLGDDNFVIVTSIRKARNLCQRIITEFDRQKKTLYTNEDIVKGFMEYESRSGIKKRCPVMRLCVAVVNSKRHVFHNYNQVIEAASEQLDYIRRVHGASSYYDLPEYDKESDTGDLPKAKSRAFHEENKTLQGVLAWLSSLTVELKEPVMTIDKYLKFRESEKYEKKNRRYLPVSVQNSVSRLINVTEILESLVIDNPPINTVPEEVDLESTIDWIVNQIQDQAKQRDIRIIAGNVIRGESLVVDSKILAQCLLYVLRTEIELCSSGDSLTISSSRENEDSVSVEVSSTRYIPPGRLRRLVKSQVANFPYDVHKNKLYPAKLLAQGLGGNLSITSKKQLGTIYAINIPRRWRSWMAEVNALLFATDISRKQARSEIKNIHNLLISLVGEGYSSFEETLSELRNRVQELGILCNRALYLAEDFNSRLQVQQDLWLHQEVDQVSTLEAVLSLSGEIAKLATGDKRLFNPVCAKRVSKNSLLIASELKMTESERKALHYAGMLKDLGLVLSSRDMVERMIVPNVEEAIAVRDRFNRVWKSLSMIPFFTTALAYVLYRYEHFDGTGGRFGVSGIRIPLGARILAVVDTFDSLISNLSPGSKISPKTAVRQIVKNSGTLFDPDIVNAFLLTWKRQDLQMAAIES